MGMSTNNLLAFSILEEASLNQNPYTLCPNLQSESFLSRRARRHTLVGAGSRP